jgi:hypothetical protein
MAINKTGKCDVVSVLDAKGGIVMETCPECQERVQRPMTREAYKHGEQAKRQCTHCGKPYTA